MIELSNENKYLSAVFLDRDGTLNVEKHYVHKREDWQWINGAMEAIKLLNESGFLTIVVSNQAGIARGYYDETTLHKLQVFIQAELATIGAHIDGFYHCPHHPDFSGACVCRKPATGMLLHAAREHNIDLASSWLIGDKASDIEAGLAAGVTPILVQTGYGNDDATIVNCLVLKDIGDAVHYVLQQDKVA